MHDQNRHPRSVILLVDDDPLVLRTHERLLRPAGEVVTARSAEEALLKLASRRFDLVITDYQMPGHDGVWLLARARFACPSIGRVLVSGGTPPALDELVATGVVQEFHHKPVDADDFVLCPVRQAQAAALAAASKERWTGYDDGSKHLLSTVLASAAAA